MAKSKIHIKESKKGTFTAAAKKHGKSVQAFASQVLAHKENYSPAMVKKANFAKNATKFNHEDGGYLHTNANIRRRAQENEEYLHELNEGEYGLGSWLGDNVGNIAQTVGGTALMFVPGGQPIGAGMLVGGASGFAKDAIGSKNEKDLNAQNVNASIGRNRLASAGQQQQVLPTFAWGGTVSPAYWNDQAKPMANMYAKGGTLIDYGLGSYRANDYLPSAGTYAAGGMIAGADNMNAYGYNLMANGGNINNLRNPNYYGANQGYAKGGHLPQGNATVEEAKEFEKLYPAEFEAGTEVEYEHTGNKKLAQRIVADHIKDSIKINKGGEPDYYKKLQDAGISDELNKMPDIMAKGGHLSVAKAKEILRDGTIRGKKITEKQKRYFGFIAGGGNPNKQDGGPILGEPSATSVVHNYQWTPQTRASVYPYLAKAGLVGSGVDSLSQQQWNSLPADSTLKYLNDPTIDYTKGNTANPGGIKYWTRDVVGDVSKNRGFSDAYWKAKKATQYANGGYFGPAATLSGGIGDSQSFNDVNPVTNYAGGGTHQQNPNGGIPIGKAKVEEGEVRVDFDNGSYIFSNRY